MKAQVPPLLTTFVVVMLPVVCALGIWQLNRAEEKEALEIVFAERLNSPVRTPQGAIQPFDRISLSGEYGTEQFLVDNQIHQGKVGYWVVQTFRDGRGDVYLINRGWVVAPPSRDQLPEIEGPSGVVSLQALVWPQLGLPPVWGQDEWASGEIVRVQQRDIPRMAERAGAKPLELRLESGSPGALVPAPQQVDFGRATHLGYAVQWFGLGTVLIAGWIIVYRKQRKEVAL
ncbi:MAG: SURF1 family protein [Gammaproteobacteria bacterium]|nr:SURF1 family protein [Gammaproteobacteria bacterium]